MRKGFFLDAILIFILNMTGIAFAKPPTILSAEYNHRKQEVTISFHYMGDNRGSSFELEIDDYNIASSILYTYARLIRKGSEGREPILKTLVFGIRHINKPVNIYFMNEKNEVFRTFNVH